MTVYSNQTTMPDGTVDAELTTLARDPAKKLVNHNGFSGGAKVKQQSHVDGWHTDSSFEVSCALHSRLSASLSHYFALF